MIADALLVHDYTLHTTELHSARTSYDSRYALQHGTNYIYNTTRSINTTEQTERLVVVLYGFTVNYMNVRSAGGQTVSVYSKC